MEIETVKYNPAFLQDDKLVAAFVVRQDTLTSILQIIRENTGASNQHVLIIGARGMGKTMLVRRTATAIREDSDLVKVWHPVVFTEESYSVTNAGEFWLEALLHIGNERGHDRWKQAYDELSKEKDPARLCERALSLLMAFADNQHKRLILMVENLGMLFDTQMSGDEAWNIRHTLSNEPRLMLMGTALPLFDEVQNADKAMFELFKTYELSRLDKEGCRTIWKFFTGSNLEDNRIRPVEILTGGNPRLMAIIANFSKNISVKELLGNLMRLVDDHTEYFKSHLDNLTPQERKVYVALLEIWAPAMAREIASLARLEINETSAILARLAGKGAVTPAAGHGRAKLYQSAERMFNIYWLMRRHGEPARRVKAVVDFMVHFYGEKEISGVMRSLAEETQTLKPGARDTHYHIYREILTARPDELWKEKCLEGTPSYFFQLNDIPTQIVNEKANICSNLGLKHFSEGNYAEAKVNFQEAEKLGNEAMISVMLGITLCELQQYKEAIERLEKILQENPKLVWAWRVKGVALMKSEKLEDAVKCFDKALKIEPDDDRTLELKGNLLLQLNKPLESLEDLDKALKINPKSATAWKDKGFALMELKKTYEEVLACFDTATDIDPSNTMSWYIKGILNMALGKPESVIKAAKKYYEDDKTIAATIPSAISFAVDMAANGFTGDAINIINESPSAKYLEPLLAGLRLYAGEEINVPEEVKEVASDIVEKIKQKGKNIKQN